MAPHSDGQPFSLLGFIFTIFFIINAYFDCSYTAPLLASVVLFSLIWLLTRPQREGAFICWAWTLAGILYVGWMLSNYVALRGFTQGREWVLFVLFSTFACDTGAFFVGRAWGRRRLAPTISPEKSWEGAVGGFLAACAAASILNVILGLPSTYGEVILLGCLIGVFAQLGDLSESLLKRSAGVKDSGGLIPGHGGILDRADSVAFTGVVVYYYLIWIG
jgi:phosphatidate cytidylyltransferase